MQIQRLRVEGGRTYFGRCPGAAAGESGRPLYADFFLTSSPPQAARIPTVSCCFCRMTSVGSSHNRRTSAEDHEEASLLGCPPIGLATGRMITQNCAFYPRSEGRGFTAHFGKANLLAPEISKKTTPSHSQPPLPLH